MESHADRPEIREALAHGLGESVRWSHTVSANLKYVAVRVGPSNQPLGVVRVAMPIKTIVARTEPAQRLMIAIAAVSVVAAVVLALALALLWSRPIQHITDTARSIARGDLSARARLRGHDEVALLGRSLNRMQERLLSHAETIDRQRRTLESLVEQLHEGVVVADGDGRIVLINQEAVRMLQPQFAASGVSMVGMDVEQGVPQLQLQRMLDAKATARRESPAGRPDAPAAWGSSAIVECRLRVETSLGVRTLLARAADIRLPEETSDPEPGQERHAGRVLLLTDVTELTRMMQVKADLAANASHELRTPLSAIRAAVETLRSIDAAEDAPAAAGLLDVVDRHSSRMEAMIKDLLELSRLESGAARFDIGQVDPRLLVDDLERELQPKISAKKLQFRSKLEPPGATVRVNRELLRMVLRNLIDNAVRFTDEDGTVTVSCRLDDSAAIFKVADTGCGIPAHEQSRVFERFYQVERARSGLDRGTGLGLSIVRHASAAMNATVALESELGVGTTITVRIPQKT